MVLFHIKHLEAFAVDDYKVWQELCLATVDAAMSAAFSVFVLCVVIVVVFVFVLHYKAKSSPSRLLQARGAIMLNIRLTMNTLMAGGY